MDVLCSTGSVEEGTRKVEAVLKQLAARTAAMQEALALGDMNAFSQLNQDVAELSDQLRLLQRPKRGSRTSTQGSRDMVLDALAELGAPTEAKMMSRYVAARFSQQIPTSRYASLRRDDRRTGELAERRPSLVPVLDSARFTPVPGLLARSTWPLEDRIAAPRSRRVFLLQVTKAMMNKLSWLREAEADVAGQVERLAADVARTVPGATKNAWSGLDVDTAVLAIDAELAVLLEIDRPQREAAARRGAVLTSMEQLFGTEGLRVVETGK